jgi:cobalt-zinc-cadmium efflux system outer membrane protein
VTGGYKNERTGVEPIRSGFIAQVAIPLPLWDRRGGAVAAAGATGDARVSESEVAVRRLTGAVHEAFQDQEGLSTQIGTLSAELGDEAERALRAANTAYAEGDISLIEWLDAVRAYQEAAASLASLTAEYIIRIAALERATGIPLL